MGVVGAGVEAPDGEEAEAMRVGCREGPDALDDVDSRLRLNLLRSCWCSASESLSVSSHTLAAPRLRLGALV